MWRPATSSACARFRSVTSCDTSTAPTICPPMRMGAICMTTALGAKALPDQPGSGVRSGARNDRSGGETPRNPEMSRTNLSNESDRRASARSKAAARAGWSIVSRYPAAILEANHSLAPRTASGSGGGSKSTGSVRSPRNDAAPARNQASNSRFAITTAILRSERDALARIRRVGPRAAGQSSSASASIRIRPPGPVRRAMKSVARSISPGLTSLPRGRRKGRSTSSATSGATIVAKRRTRIGAASTSPNPSTTSPRIILRCHRIVGVGASWPPLQGRAEADPPA